jgi:DnaJ homologue, subfamily C, member 28, conserved domain
MTERKPPNVSFEHFVDKQIREAMERGEFDDLPGAGKPIPGLDRPYDEQWWVKGLIRREGLSAEGMLPTSLRLRAEIERLPDRVRELPSERAVRDAVAELNERIADWVRLPTGPYAPITEVDAEAVVRRWRAERRR